ncbi:MAG: APC family permease [Acidimicrobiia bacterium]
MTLRRHLTMPDVIAQSVSVMAPAMSGALLTYAAAIQAGGATPLSFLLATIGALAIGAVVAEFSRSMASAGSLYTYTAAGLSKTAGFVLGWIYVIAFITLGGAVLAGFGAFLSLAIQSMTGSETAIPWWIFFLIGVAFVIFVSMVRVRLSTRSQLVLTFLSVAAMLIAAVVVIAGGGAGGNPIDFAAFSPSAAGIPWTGVLFGLAFGLLSFTGFEAGAVLAEETENPHHNIPRAIFLSVLFGGIFYVIVTYATSIGFGVQEAAEAWPASAAGLVAVVPNAALGTLVLFAVAASSLICGLGVHTAVARMLFAMGRERVLPAGLGALHPTWRTPHRAIIFNGILIAVLVLGLPLVVGQETTDLLAPGLPPEQQGGIFAFAYWATLATPAVMFSYVLLGLAGIRKGSRDNNGRFVAVSVLAVIVGAAAVFGSIYFGILDDAPWVFRLTWIGLVVLIVSGLVIAILIKARNPRAWDAMGSVFDEG